MKAEKFVIGTVIRNTKSGNTGVVETIGETFYSVRRVDTRQTARWSAANCESVEDRYTAWYLDMDGKGIEKTGTKEEITAHLEAVNPEPFPTSLVVSLPEPEREQNETAMPVHSQIVFSMPGAVNPHFFTSEEISRVMAEPQVYSVSMAPDAADCLCGTKPEYIRMADTCWLECPKCKRRTGAYSALPDAKIAWKAMNPKKHLNPQEHLHHSQYPNIPLKLPKTWKAAKSGKAEVKVKPELPPLPAEPVFCRATGKEFWPDADKYKWAAEIRCHVMNEELLTRELRKYQVEICFREGKHKGFFWVFASYQSPLTPQELKTSPNWKTLLYECRPRRLQAKLALAA